MTGTKRRLGAVSLALLVLGLLVPVAAGGRIEHAAAAVPSVESQLLALTNADRARAGLHPLSSSSTLVSVARSWATHMAATGVLGHNPSLAAHVSGWSMLGENCAGRVSSAAQAESLFMGSSGHRANILQPKFNRVGIGVARAADGTYWVTVDFEQAAGSAAAPVSSSHTSPTHRASTSTHVRSAATTSSTRAVAAARAGRSAVRAPLAHTLPLVRPVSATLLARAARVARLDAVGPLSGEVVPVTFGRLPAAPDPPGTPLPRVLAELAVLLAAAAAAGGLLVRRARVRTAPGR